ncbi:hydroxylase [Rhodococcus sp. ABRD24]|uniref:NmrA family NAD(P)-binding protein n=1 Tax=Rhodococcus sp. ABRD24 TaxID=2507582 RepID=UPI00103C11EF|nr:NmrA family NAD(P)-binding protein [Rhodococcus sp. ABRD24]QBJ96092.1 hydroxylase [Rhodococcus sp. ABRD24]
MTYAVHGAAGAQGSPVLSALVASGAEVRALTRDRSKTFAGAVTTVVENNSAETLAAAYTGVDGVFVHLPLAGDPQTPSRHVRNIVAAAASARPARMVVSTSGTAIGDSASPLAGPNTPILTELVDGLASAGITVTVLSPRLFLENLLLPPVLGGVMEEGVLRYPLRSDLAVSWCSHLDVADAAVVALTAPEAPDLVNIGQIPPVTGPQLAAAFAEHLGRPVVFDSITPADFGASLEPMLGAGAAAGVAQLYTALGVADEVSFEQASGSGSRLGVRARSTRDWLAALGI